MKNEFLINKRKTKLVITMGPALQDGVTLRKALKLADAVRLNASHSKPGERTPVLKLIRKVSDDLGRIIPVFLDLQGPKWRIGLLEVPIILEKDHIGVLYAAGTPSPKVIRGQRLCRTRSCSLAPRSAKYGFWTTVR